MQRTRQCTGVVASMEGMINKRQGEQLPEEVMREDEEEYDRREEEER